MYQYLETGNYSNQRWHLGQFGDTTWNGHPVVALWDGNADNCLDESRDAPAKDGTAVYTYHCSFQPNQLWRLVPHPKYGGYFELRNHYDGRCLDIKDFAYNNGGGIQVWKCTSDWNEAWA